MCRGHQPPTIAGSEATFTVRPEKIRLADRDAAVSEGECAVAGTIRDVVYLGVNTRYIVALQTGGELVVIQQNQSTSSMDALAARGSEVKLIWGREHNRRVDVVPRNTEEVSA